MSENGKMQYTKPVLVNYGSIAKITLSGGQSHLASGGSEWDALTGDGGSAGSVS
jgi:hypothetical protein